MSVGGRGSSDRARSVRTSARWQGSYFRLVGDLDATVVHIVEASGAGPRASFVSLCSSYAVWSARGFDGRTMLLRLVHSASTQQMRDGGRERKGGGGFPSTLARLHRASGPRSRPGGAQLSIVDEEVIYFWGALLSTSPIRLCLWLPYLAVDDVQPPLPFAWSCSGRAGARRPRGLGQPTAHPLAAGRPRRPRPSPYLVSFASFSRVACEAGIRHALPPTTQTQTQTQRNRARACAPPSCAVAPSTCPKGTLRRLVARRARAMASPSLSGARVEDAVWP